MIDDSRMITREELEEADVFIFSVTITKEEFIKAFRGEPHNFMAAFNPVITKKFTAEKTKEIANKLSLYASHLVDLYRRQLIDEKIEESKDALDVPGIKNLHGENNGGGKLN